MRRVMVIALVCATAFIAAVPALAGPVDKAVSALKHGNVYVDPATEGTTPESADILAGKLSKGDNIVLVMLPTSQADNLSSLIQRIDTVTGHNKIIGLSAGDNSVAAYSAQMPPTTASVLMRTAQSVSTNQVETLQTFVQNVHDWQTAHPHAPASKPAHKGGNSIIGKILGAALGLIIAFICFGVYKVMTQDSDTKKTDQVQLKSSPGTVKDTLEQIADMRSQVNNPALRATITQACRDTDAYFQRAARQGGKLKEGDAKTLTIKKHLESVRAVIDKYIDVQDNQRYFDNPSEYMRQGEEAVSGYADFILDSIKHAGRMELTEFKVDTDILRAQSWRNR